MKSFIMILPMLLCMAAAALERNPEQLSPVLAQRASAQRGAAHRIIGGYPVKDRKEAPYMGSLWDLYYGDFHICGCSIIDKYHILTAAHCVEAPEAPEDYRIHVGFADYDTSDPNAQERNVSRICRHPAYNSDTEDNDVAIIKLDKPLQLNEWVQPIALYDEVEPMHDGYPLKVTGWGVTNASESEGSYNLMTVDINYVDDAKCVESYASLRYLVNPCDMCCAGATGKDSCQGDSGGPLTCKYSDGTKYQVGIVSWGYGCAQAGYPGVYTKVHKYRGWIEESMSNVGSSECTVPSEEYTC